MKGLADDNEHEPQSGRGPEGSVRPGALVELDRAECFRLLGGHRVGRIAVVDRDDMPFVVPVNYVLSSDTVLFRTHPGTKLDALRRRPVAFQVDSIDEVHRTGWSVLIQGIAHEASPDDHVVAHPEPWAEAGPYWIQVVPRFISGRRFQIDDEGVASRESYDEERERELWTSLDPVVD